MMGGGGMMGGFGLIGMIFNLLILIGIVLLVFWAVKHFASSSPTSVQTPKEILQARYARGEITREQYQQMLADVS